MRATHALKEQREGDRRDDKGYKREKNRVEEREREREWKRSPSGPEKTPRRQGVEIEMKTGERERERERAPSPAACLRCSRQ